MKLSKEELARLYREQTRRSAAGRAGCLSSERMARACSGNLTRAERGQVAVGRAEDAGNGELPAREKALELEGGELHKKGGNF